jgi:dienelactone hydrolase
MNEFPVFVPTDGKRIAAVVTIPDRPPRGVVLFATGGGGTLRSQRFRLWTRAARALGEIDIASVRMEFAGVGDSTGEVTIGFKRLPVDDLVDVAKFAMRAAGTERLGMCGNCGGARTALKAAAALPTCQSMVLFWLKPLARAAKGKPLSRTAFRIAPRLPVKLRRLLTALYFRMQARVRGGNDVFAALRSVSGSTDLLLVETHSKLGTGMTQLVSDLRSARGRRRVEMRGIDSTSMQAFQSLADQAETVEMVTAWFDHSFSSEVSPEITRTTGSPQTLEFSPEPS